MAAERALGTTLELIGTPNVGIANITSIGEIGLESEEIDVTDFDSTDDFREFIAGPKDGGEIPISGFIKDDSFVETVLELANDREVEDWLVTFPGGATWEFSGFVKAFKEGELTVDGARNYNLTIRVSGAPEYSPAGS
jgi:predicted secreted protein